MATVGWLLTLGLAAVFVWSSLTKILRPERWTADVRRYRLPQAMKRIVVLVVPWLELAIAVALLGVDQPRRHTCFSDTRSVLTGNHPGSIESSQPKPCPAGASGARRAAITALARKKRALGARRARPRDGGANRFRPALPRGERGNRCARSHRADCRRVRVGNLLCHTRLFARHQRITDAARVNGR